MLSPLTGLSSGGHQHQGQRKFVEEERKKEEKSSPNAPDEPLSGGWPVTAGSRILNMQASTSETSTRKPTKKKTQRFTSTPTVLPSSKAPSKEPMGFETTHPYSNGLSVTSPTYSLSGVNKYILTINGTTESNYDFVYVLSSTNLSEILYVNSGMISESIMISSSSGFTMKFTSDSTVVNWGINTTISPCDSMCETKFRTKDWTSTLTTPVRDQKSCGCCWAFTAAEQLESDLLREGQPYNKSKWLSVFYK